MLTGHLFSDSHVNSHGRWQLMNFFLIVSSMLQWREYDDDCLVCYIMFGIIDDFYRTQSDPSNHALTRELC